MLASAIDEIYPAISSNYIARKASASVKLDSGRVVSLTSLPDSYSSLLLRHDCWQQPRHLYISVRHC